MRAHARRMVGLAIVAPVAAFGLPAATAGACTYPAQTPKARVAVADAAIYGEVVSVRSLADPDDASRPIALTPYEAKIRVRRVYKGRIGPAVRIRAHTAEPTCGLGVLRVGQRIGLLLHRPGPPFTVSLDGRMSVRELRAATRGRFHRPGPPASKRCAAGSDAPVLRLGAVSGPAGTTVPVTLLNCSASSFGSGLKLLWEARQPDGSFVPVTPPGPFTQELYAIHAREVRDFSAPVWVNLQPGEHRAALRLTAGGRFIDLYAGPFRVTPRAE